MDKRKQMNRLDRPQLSLVIPAYNEEDHIAEIVDRTDWMMKNISTDYEIIIVNDGSKDATGFKAFECVKDNERVRVVSHYRNMGKGYAVRTGFFSATGDSVVFIDGDMEIEPSQIIRYVDALKTGDIVIGSKRHPQSQVEIPILRRFLSWGFNILVRSLTGLKLKDTQSGLKAVRRKTLERVFSDLSVKRYAFDVELLAVADLRGLTVVEMPVNIRSTGSFFSPKEILRMFIDLLGVAYRIRIKKSYLESTLEFAPEKAGVV